VSCIYTFDIKQSMTSCKQHFLASRPYQLLQKNISITALYFGSEQAVTKDTDSRRTGHVYIVQLMHQACRLPARVSQLLR